MEIVMMLVESAVQFIRAPIFMNGSYGTLFFWLILGVMGEVAIIVFRSMIEG